MRTRIDARASIDALVLGTLFAGLTVWSWRTWPDILIDFGRELYTPWRLAEGAVLYRDVASLFGPLSQYVNAALFRVFGTSYTTLLVANLAILAGLGVVVYRFFAAACDRLTAAAAVGVLFTIFGFASPLAGSFNFVAPYAHEATHGLVLSVCMLYAAQRFVATGAAAWAAAAGGSLGLTLLTKPEIALAALAAAAAGAVLVALVPALSPLRSRRALAAFGISVAAGPVAFWAYFLTAMPPGQAMGAVLGAWTPLVTAAPASNAFYATQSGFDAPMANLLRMGQLATFVAAVLGVWLVIDGVAARNRPRQGLIAGLASLGFAGTWLAAPLNVITDIGLVLPVLVVVVLAALAWRAIAARRQGETLQHLMPLLLWCVFALGLLAKLLLNVRLYGYGFVLALPASLLVVAAAVSLIPSALRRYGGSGIPFRSLALTAISVIVVLHVLSWHGVNSVKTYPVGSGGDTMFTYAPRVSPMGPFVAEALEHIERLAAPDGTLLVLPEGVTLNYLTRRRNPTPYINFMLPEVVTFGEASIVAALDESPPELVVLVHKNTREYGVGFFGADPRYGQQVMDWVARHYAPAVLIGSEPLQSDAFGIKLLRRRR